MDDDLLKAVNEAIDAETIPPEPAGEEQEGDDDAGGDTEGTDTGESGDQDSDAEGGDTAADSDGDEGAGDEGSEGEGEDAGEDGEDGDDEAGDGAAPPDPVNDPIPEELKEKTRERIQTLIDRVKETGQYKDQYNELVGMITGTGASPEEFGMLIEYSRLSHSTDPGDRRKALEVLRAEARALAIELGEVDAGFNPIGEFPDLKAAVDTQDITEEHAREVAMARLRQQAQQERATQTAQQQQAQQANQAEIQRGMQELDALEQQLRASDPQYDAKRQAIVRMMKPAFQRGDIHPSRWAAAFRDAYQNFDLPAPPAPKPRPAPKQQPLRAKTPAGGGQKEAGSALDALNQALGGMG
jgi:hypothetical protein